jgi:anionic cell wall polymer biosynthesis LytR-Cps2A-Psr (LCP) family protein
MQRDEYGNVNVLLLGYGGANHDGGYLTDSIIVASRNPEHGNISMFSIPRDLYVLSPITKGYGRINAIFTQFMGRNQKDIHVSAS